MKTTIYWITKEFECINLIRDLCNLPTGITINGETTVNASDECIEILRKYEKMGFIQLRNKP